MGLIQLWLSPEALPFLELTSEKQLEVSETDARALLDEHSLPVPEISSKDFLSRFNLPLIDKAFGAESVPKIEEELKRMSTSNDSAAKAFADDCLKRMSCACPLALHATFQLIRDARSARRSQASGGGLGVRMWEVPGQMETSALMRALRLEMRAQHRLLVRDDAAVFACKVRRT